jgi:hypothetical protein
MKRTGGGEGFSVMKRDHSEKKMPDTSVSDLQYGRSKIDNEPELRDSVNALSSYVKKNKMKY